MIDHNAGLQPKIITVTRAPQHQTIIRPHRRVGVPDQYLILFAATAASAGPEVGAADVVVAADVAAAAPEPKLTTTAALEDADATTEAIAAAATTRAMKTDVGRLTPNG